MTRLEGSLGRFQETLGIGWADQDPMDAASNLVERLTLANLTERMPLANHEQMAEALRLVPLLGNVMSFILARCKTAFPRLETSNMTELLLANGSEGYELMAWDNWRFLLWTGCIFFLALVYHAIAEKTS